MRRRGESPDQHVGVRLHISPLLAPHADPRAEEKFSLLVKEVHLPFSEQTHEVVFEPRTRCLFVTQMSNSVLVRVPVGAPPSFEHVGRTLEEKRGQP